MDNTIIIILTFFLLLILGISLYFLFRKKETVIDEELEILDQANEMMKIKPVKPIIETVNITEEIKNSTIKEKKTQVKETSLEPKLSINIASKTEKNLLNRLEEFEKNKDFLKKDINLNSLSKEFETNTKYLSELIKTYKNKNFNQYLNELKIDHLIRELNNNDKLLNTKVSYLAGDFGFNSHSSFSTVFTQYIGKSPSEFIKELKKEKHIK